VKVDVVLLDNHGYGCIHNLQRGTGGRSFNNEFRARNNGRLSGDNVAIDFVKNAESYGARAFTARTERELVQALADMRAEKRACFLYVPLAETSKLPGTSWWDVPPAEVSTVASVNEARAAYDEAVKKQRFHH
jgi:3D-(3,5/4)-trihydroxycyclohexane-1,2-dione acylhydrolase (decyclizing)